MTDQTVVPYLFVNGADKAIAFYRDAFGATEKMRMPTEDGKRVMHAELAINGGKIFLCDEQGPDSGQRSPAAVVLALPEPAKVDATFRQALSAGARSDLEPADQFWGARFAMLTDPFGHRWMLNAPLKPG